MIPAGGFLAIAPATSQVVNYPLPKPIVLSYKEGADPFIPEDRVPPFEIVALSQGLFEGRLVSGNDGSKFGFRAELRRSGVYGTILIDRLVFNVAAVQLLIEGCPDVTDEVEETSLIPTLAGEEACPSITVATEEITVPISTLMLDT